MLRVVHRWPGLVAGLLLMVLSLSGTALSIFPAVEKFSSPQADAALSIADLVGRVQTAYPELDEIRRAPSGRITAYWFKNGTPQASVIDPATGRQTASADPSALERWLMNFHRSLFLDDGGRIATAAAAAVMLALSVSGIVLVFRRVGGWQRSFARLRGPLSGRLHVDVARLTVAGLLISSATALWMTASTFDLLPDGATLPILKTQASGLTGADLARAELLQLTPVSHMRSLSFADPGDPADLIILKTDQGTAYIDQGTGTLLALRDLTAWQRLSDFIYMLHTGRGASAFGLLLGLMALGVPVMAGTGCVVWLTGRRTRSHIRGNVSAARAHTIILVGSEGGSTWGFAATLHAALSDAGQTAHVAPMSSFDPPRYRQAQRILILAATYGHGDAPACAKGFLDRIRTHPPMASVAVSVLGFGDRGFPAYCAFAELVSQAVGTAGWNILAPFDTVDRQSPQDFARWGQRLGDAMGIDLILAHRPDRPATGLLTLVSRRDYGAQVQSPTAILRFALPKPTLVDRLLGNGLGRYAAGDLLGIVPMGSTVPRFYSLASSWRDGFVEIVVKRHPAGLCSGQLFELRPGDTVSAFVRPNPGFSPGRSRSPLILIGAGTGIGPLAGFVRGNMSDRPIHLFFGMRHAESDFLYREELGVWQREGHLERLATTCSRGCMPRYVQHAVREEAAEIVRLVRQGARVMVCGGREMALGVSLTLADILEPAGLTPAALKAEGRYVEDVY